jgi:hypothetical protein
MPKVSGLCAGVPPEGRGRAHKEWRDATLKEKGGGIY